MSWLGLAMRLALVGLIAFGVFTMLIEHRNGSALLLLIALAVLIFDLVRRLRRAGRAVSDRVPQFTE